MNIKRNLHRQLLFAALLLCAIGGSAAARIICVDDDGPADFTSIQAAIDDANDGDEIEVGPGTYYESVSLDGKAVGLYGVSGAALTVIDATGLNENVVVCNNGEDQYTVIMGFTLTGGDAPGTGSDRDGAGIFCYAASPTIVNCIVTGNDAGDDGGGIFLDAGSNATIIACKVFDNQSGDKGGGLYSRNSNPEISDSFFAYNSSGTDGGGVYFVGGDPVISGCVFEYNYSGDDGGGLYNQDGEFSMENCLVVENEAYDKGGGIYSRNSDPVISNCTFKANEAVKGGGVYNSSADAVVENCILWANTASSGSQIYNYDSQPTLSYCDVQFCGGSGAGWNSATGTDGGGNIDSDPDFADADGDPAGPDGVYKTPDDALMLEEESLCIDAADGDVAPELDFGRNARCDVETVVNTGTGTPNYTDMGAYEPAIFPETMASPSYSQIPDGVICVNKNSVDPGGPSDDDYGSWSTAYRELGDALASNPAPNTQIWVARGVYTPAPADGSRTATFNLIDGVAIRGGYRALLVAESDQTVRNVEVYQTILSGDLNGDDNNGGDNSENSYHVVTASGNDATAVLDGVTITAGNADLHDIDDIGAGMRCVNAGPTLVDCVFRENVADNFAGGMYNSGGSPTLTNCTFIQNTNSGMYNSGSPTLTSCKFLNNTSRQDGRGGGFCDSGTPTLIDCVFSGNTDAGSYVNDGGGAMYTCGEPTLINCVFTGNSAANRGGAIWFWASTPATLTNCTFTGNSAPNGDAIACDSAYQNGPSTLQIRNSIIWNGANAIWNNDSSTITLTATNTSQDPHFVNPGSPAGPDEEFFTADDGLALDPDSTVCIDTGQNAYVTVTNDIAGKKRITGRGATPLVDMGAYEALPAAGHWRLDDGEGTTAADTSTYDGLTTNGTLQSSAGSGPLWRDGIAEYALQLEGDDDFVSIANSGAFSTRDDFTWSAWIRTLEDHATEAEQRVITAGGAIIAKCHTTGASDVNCLYVVDEATANDGRLAFAAGGVTGSPLLSTARVDDGLWHHVAVTVEFGAVDAVTLYIDGDQRAAAEWDIPYCAEESLLRIGYANPDFPASGQTCFAGRIDEVRVYDYALDGPQVDSLFRETGYWRFVTASDSQDGDGTPGITTGTLEEISLRVVNEKAEVFIVPGDLVYGRGGDPGETQLSRWRNGYQTSQLASRLYHAGVEVMPIRGNHDVDSDHIDTPNWVNVFGPDIPDNGPAGETDCTYFIEHRNALLIALDQFAGAAESYPYNRIDQNWLNGVLVNNTWAFAGDDAKRHVFLAAHEPAFRLVHNQTMAAVPGARDIFWQILEDEPGCRLFFCGHDHFYSNTRVDNRDAGRPNVHQMTVATIIGGGGWDGNYQGDVGVWWPTEIFHDTLGQRKGYVLVEVWGSSRITSHWKRRTDSGDYLPGGDVFEYAVPEQDTQGPRIRSAEVQDATTIVLTFDEWVDETSAETAANYTLDRGASVTGAVLDPDNHRIVTLTTSTLSGGYTLDIDGVTDLSANQNQADESVGVSMPWTIIGQTDTDWRYFEGTSEPPSNWNTTGFTGTWTQGRTSIGYGDGDDNTVLDMQGHFSTVYLRRTFNIATAGEIPGEIALGIYVDDGCIVYINDIEVERFHVDDGVTKTYDSFADQSHNAVWEQTSPEWISAAPYSLQVGDNVLAIHALNINLSQSTDFSIDAELRGR